MKIGPCETCHGEGKVTFRTARRDTPSSEAEICSACNGSGGYIEDIHSGLVWPRRGVNAYEAYGHR